MSINTEAAKKVLAAIDRRLPDLFEKLRVGDVVVITGDHGRDLTRPAKVSTREYVPLLVTGPKLSQGVNLGVRASAADLGQSIVEALKAERLPVGESFFVGQAMVDTDGPRCGPACSKRRT